MSGKNYIFPRGGTLWKIGTTGREGALWCGGGVFVFATKKTLPLCFNAKRLTGLNVLRSPGGTPQPVLEGSSRSTPTQL